MSDHGLPPASESAGNTFGKDFLASFVVFLVALPLCMGIALASGAPIAAGLITGIIGGIIVGTLAGSPLQVSGPAAGLTVIVYQAIQQHGLEMLGLVVLIAGTIQLVAGLLRWGQWFRAVSPAVIQGMLAGIGVLLLASQFHIMVDDKPRGDGLANLLAIPEAIQKGAQLTSLDSESARQFKRRKLQEVGELHRQQVRIEERVHEQLPDHHMEKIQELTGEPLRPASEERWLKLAEQQTALAAALDNLTTEVQEFHAENGQDAKREEMLVSLGEAKTAVATAQVHLEEQKLLKSLKSQAAAVKALDDVLEHTTSHSLAAGLGLLTISLIILWQCMPSKKIKLIPAALVAIMVATAAATLLKLPVMYVEVPARLWDDISLPRLAVWQDAPWPGLFQTGLVIAIVASAETLLCATAVDQMHNGPRTKYDRELAAQGIGNMACGLLGALPMTGVIVRSSANVQVGAKTRLSAILHGVWLLVFVVALGSVLRLIPTASLAAMLVFTGYKLVNWRVIPELKKHGWGEVLIYFATVIGIVSLDLLSGVLIGVALSATKLLYIFTHLKITTQRSQEGRRVDMHLEGSCTFIGLPKLAAALEEIPGHTELHVHLDHLRYVDHACLTLLDNWGKQHQGMGGKLFLDWGLLFDRSKGKMSRKTKAAAEPAREVA